MINPTFPMINPSFPNHHHSQALDDFLRALRLDTDFCSGDQSPRSDAVPLANWAAREVGQDSRDLAVKFYRKIRGEICWDYRLGLCGL